jgi:hypothetical protein
VRLFIRCIEFFMLKAFGRGMCVLRMCTRYWASLYAGACFQLTTGRIGMFVLCTLVWPWN